MKKRMIKIAALLLAAFLLFGCLACGNKKNDEPKEDDGQTAETEEENERNPGIGKVGTVSFKLSDYVNYFNQYAMYANYIEDYNAFIKDTLLQRGIILTKAKEANITLTEEEEQEIRRTAWNQIEQQLAGMTIDPEITGAEAIKKAQIEALNERLEEVGFYRNADELEAEIIKTLREDKLIAKLREQVVSAVRVDPEEVNSYVYDNWEKAREQYETNPSAFSAAYSNFITGSGAAPLYTPADTFTVKHCLIQFENQGQVSDTAEGYFTAEQQKKIDAITASIPGMTLAEFIEAYVQSGDYNDDTVFIPLDSDEGTVETNPQLGYRIHGYVVNADLLDRYYEGFGAAACVLYYGQDWQFTVGETGSAVNAAEKYGVELFTTSDGVKIAKVQTNVRGGGVHFIFISELLPEGRLDLSARETDANAREAYESIEKSLLTEAQTEHFSELLEQWKTEIKAELKDELIDDYCKNTLGYSPAEPND